MSVYVVNLFSHDTLRNVEIINKYEYGINACGVLK